MSVLEAWFCRHGTAGSEVEHFMDVVRFSSVGVYMGWLTYPSPACAVGTAVILPVRRWGSPRSER